MISTISDDITASKCYIYAEEVLSYKITASKKVIAACQRFVDDIKQSADPSYPWVFDIEKAYRPINFIEQFCNPTKGDYDRMKLLPWQHFVQGNMYGWVDKKTRLRRFREGLIIVGRGNGKSTMVVGNALYGASKDGENGADVYLLANSKEQAGIVFEECKTQVENNSVLCKYFKPLRNVIYYDKTNSKIQHRASDSRKLDGLNPYVAIFDETHEFTNFKLVNVINRPMDKKRKQPLTIYITTMGTVLGGVLMSHYQLASNVLFNQTALNKRVADRFFCFIAEIDETDEPNDTNCWIKANPSLGALFQMQDLVDDWERAKQTPEERSDFINKQLNVFTAIDEMSMLDAETIRKNDKVIDIERLTGRKCYGGFDLSSTEDFTSACLEFPIENNQFFALSHSWTTKKKVEADHEKLDWYNLQREGYLTIVDGEYVDYSLVYDWFIEHSKKYRIETIGYDPHNAFLLWQKLQQTGFTVSPVVQNYTLNAPLKNLKERFLDGNIIHNKNIMLNWYLSNVKLIKDRNGNWLPTKQNKYRKIDGFAALLDAHSEYIRNNPIEVIPDKKISTVIKLR